MTEDSRFWRWQTLCVGIICLVLGTTLSELLHSRADYHTDVSSSIADATSTANADPAYWGRQSYTEVERLSTAFSKIDAKMEQLTQIVGQSWRTGADARPAPHESGPSDRPATPGPPKRRPAKPDVGRIREKDDPADRLANLQRVLPGELTKIQDEMGLTADQLSKAILRSKQDKWMQRRLVDKLLHPGSKMV